MTTLTNTFHNTEYRTRYTREQLNKIMVKYDNEQTPAEKRLVRRIRQALCGMDDCCCGQNELDERN